VAYHGRRTRGRLYSVDLLPVAVPRYARTRGARQDRPKGLSAAGCSGSQEMPAGCRKAGENTREKPASRRGSCAGPASGRVLWHREQECSCASPAGVVWGAP